MKDNSWYIFKGDGEQKSIKKFPKAPPWRQGRKKSKNIYIPDKEEKELDAINTAIYLKRPLLVTGNPGIGKSTLAYAIAKELGLELVKWEITTKSTLKDGLYSYDAIARLQDVSLKKKTSINDYLFLGPLGYAFSATNKPKVLLIDEIDKSDIDLPHDLLHILEEMEFVIPELERVDKDGKGINIYPTHKKKAQDGSSINIKNGIVSCQADNFPIIIMTSNDNREFPPAFLRRCLRLDIKAHTKDRLAQILTKHFESIESDKKESKEETVDKIINEFLTLIKDKNAQLSTDQLLNAVYLLYEKDINILEDNKLKDTIFMSLS